ncbi:hypothetical protein SeMB42_g07990 [Synchytrium endobioticum]|uniref:Uncharacterized protein n=1 Tax=Synchytrium endobioticum TaxID=286115 RepID=A0A507BXQ0_9FUNG|nr:hypothetical protein SeMB42_g07990 [Synchytrium endobioticum]
MNHQELDEMDIDNPLEEVTGSMKVVSMESSESSGSHEEMVYVPPEELYQKNLEKLHEQVAKLLQEETNIKEEKRVYNVLHLPPVSPRNVKYYTTTAAIKTLNDIIWSKFYVDDQPINDYQKVPLAELQGHADFLAAARLRVLGRQILNTYKFHDLLDPKFPLPHYTRQGLLMQLEIITEKLRTLLEKIKEIKVYEKLLKGFPTLFEDDGRGYRSSRLPEDIWFIPIFKTLAICASDKGKLAYDSISNVIFEFNPPKAEEISASDTLGFAALAYLVPLENYWDVGTLHAFRKQLPKEDDEAKLAGYITDQHLQTQLELMSELEPFLSREGFESTIRNDIGTSNARSPERGGGTGRRSKGILGWFSG